MRIGVIGASKNRSKFGNKCVRAYLDGGYDVIPINPKEEEIEGIKCYKSISDCPVELDIVSIYLPPDKTVLVSNDLYQSGAKVIYFNPGTENDIVAKELEQRGKKVNYECSIVAIGKSPLDYT